MDALEQNDRRVVVILLGLVLSVVPSALALWPTWRDTPTATTLVGVGIALFVVFAAAAGWYFVRAGGLRSTNARRQLLPALGLLVYLGGTHVAAFGVDAGGLVSYLGLFVMLASLARDPSLCVPEVAGDGTSYAFRLRETGSSSPGSRAA